MARVATSADRMSRMISDVLDLARSRQGGGIPVAPHFASLRDVCQEVIEEFRVVHPNCDLQFQAEGSGKGMWDGDRLAQAVSNVVANAAQYGRKDGPVRIKLTDQGSQVLVSIQNDGEPIAPERLPNLFDPFRRGDVPAAAPRSGGLGLGLNIARQIGLAHGGDIDVRSDESGTAFALRLPRKEAS